MLLDEAERLREATPDAAEIRSILLAGYRRGVKATRLEKVEDGFVPVEYDCFGPKAVACIAGVPPALASRCIPFTMFRAAPGSEKPKRRLDTRAPQFAELRDDLHALALGPMGQAALDLSRRTNVCPLGNRNFELWQPLMALAAWLEEAGAAGLLAMVQSYAAGLVESSAEDATPDADETLLRVLAEQIVADYTPKPSDILAKAKEIEPEMFQRWQARAVSQHLKRYGVMSRKSNGVRFFDATVDDLRRIQQNYNIDLGISSNGE